LLAFGFTHEVSVHNQPKPAPILEFFRFSRVVLPD
jgi:hypothetical protein